MSSEVSPASHPIVAKPLSILREFREFINRGNVVDLAVGVVTGAAFSKIVTSLVEDIVMPPLGKILGDLDFSNLYLPLSEKIPAGISLADARKLGPVIAWGNFLTVSLNFLIMAGCIFALIKGVNAFRRSEAIKLVVIDKPEIALLKEIRDLLSQRNPSGNEHAQAVRAEHGH